MFKDFYQILNVDRAATDEEIRKSYRGLALKYHPDRNPDPAAHQRFIEIKEAYETLMDPSARTRFNSLYDRHYNTGKASYVHVRRSGGGYGRSKHRGRRYNRRTDAPTPPPSRRRAAQRTVSMGEEYIFSEKSPRERQAEVLGSRIGYTYFARVVRLVAVATLLLALGLVVDFVFSAKSARKVITHVNELPWSLSEPGVLRVQTDGLTLYVHRSFRQYIREGRQIALKITPMGGYVTRVYAEDRNGQEISFRPFGGLYGATFTMVILLMGISIATILTRKNDELASYVGTVNLLLFVIIFSMIKNA